jgi:hypothetical protein
MQGGTIACDADSVLTTAKSNLLLNTIIPAAQAKLQNALSVTQVSGNLVVSPGACGTPFSIPAADSSTGVADADYVLYVSAAPIAGSTRAWAGYCSLSGGRPSAA